MYYSVSIVKYPKSISIITHLARYTCSYRRKREEGGILAIPAITFAAAAGGIIRHLDHGPNVILFDDKSRSEWKFQN